MVVTVLDSQKDFYSLSTMAAKMAHLQSVGMLTGNENIININTDNYVDHEHPHYIEKVTIEDVACEYLNIR